MDMGKSADIIITSVTIWSDVHTCLIRNFKRRTIFLSGALVIKVLAPEEVSSFSQ